MIISDKDVKIVLEALRLLHLTTEEEKDLRTRLEERNDVEERKNREMHFRQYLCTKYGSNSHLHLNEYKEFIEKFEY